MQPAQSCGAVRAVAAAGRLPGRLMRAPPGIGLVMAAIMSSGGALAQGIEKDPAPMVEWLAPAQAAAKPQTDAEAKEGMKAGRPLPEPEILQPRLDPALSDYEPRRDIKLSGTFKGACSDVLPALVKRWVAGFRKYYPDADIDVSPPYAGSLGAKELVRQDLDFAFVSRELKPDDVSDFNAKFGYGPLSVPVSGGSYRHFGFLDAIGFFVNKNNPIEQLDYQQIDALFSSTHLRSNKAAKTWGDLGLTGEWADKPVHVYAIKPWNGFEEFIRQRILSVDGERGEWRDDIHYDKLVFPIAGNVAKDRYGIGYAGLAFIDAPVKMLPLAEKPAGPYYAPSYENVAFATYPLSRLIYFNTNKPPGKPLNPVLAEFLRYILSKEGQQTVLDHALYMPLRAEQVSHSRALLGR